VGGRACSTGPDGPARAMRHLIPVFVDLSKENFIIVKTTFALLFAFISLLAPGQKASICKKHKVETVHEM